MASGRTVPVIYGWPSSPYTEKVVSYVRHCGVEHRLVAPTARQLRGKIQQAVGRMIMPTMELPTGQWVQDSSDIIDYFEARRSRPLVQPPGPAQRLASAVLEFHGDEWMPMVIMHTRWNVAENRRFARREFASTGLPWCPGPIARRLVGPIVDKMAGYREVLGITEATIPGVERFLSGLLDTLEVHLEHYDYLFGGCASVADFALHGPLYAHIYRDPGSTRWFDGRPRVVQWMERLREPATRGTFLAGDEVPDTVRTLLEVAFRDQWPFARQVVDGVNSIAAQEPRPRLPRGLGWAPISIGGCTGRRKMATESQWKLQRVLDVFESEDVRSNPAVSSLLDATGGTILSSVEVKAPVVRRQGRPTFRDQTNRDASSDDAAAASG